jgi:ribosome-associated protein
MAITIPEDELVESFVRASGPGGQNVNKVSTAAQLRYDTKMATMLSAPVVERLLAIAGSRATADGVIIIQAQRFRTQERNRADALERLAGLIERALHKDPPRVRTKPSRAARQRRVDSKVKRGSVKQLRGKARADD